MFKKLRYSLYGRLGKIPIIPIIVAIIILIAFNAALFIIQPWPHPQMRAELSLKSEYATDLSMWYVILSGWIYNEGTLNSSCKITYIIEDIDGTKRIDGEYQTSVIFIGAKQPVNFKHEWGP
ncbi:MAG: hypothetical protein OEV21_04025, partial [Thermoplasmata archaeon]|nr:hypothetical protein [Thermoplasmata archaeon]